MEQRLGELTAAIKNAPPGRLAGRYFKTLFHAFKHGDSGYAERQRWIEAGTIDTIIKSGVSAHSSSDATFYPVGQDLAALLAKVSAMRQLPGFRTVPSNTNCVTQSSGATAYWGAEGAAAPLSALALARSALAGQRINALSVITQELADSSNSEMIISTDHARAIAEKLDATFFDPENQGSPEVLPKSITADAPQYVATGSTVALVDADLRLLVASLVNGGSNLLNAVWVMNPITGTYLGSLRGSGGSPSYSGMGALGGVLLGLPAITTAGVARTGSPPAGYIALVDASRVWLTDSGMTFHASKYTNMEMSDAPTGNSVTPTPVNMVSMFQTESVALLSTSYVNWKAVTNASAAAVLTGVEY